MFPQFATAKLGDRTITRKIDSEMSDAEVQALFAQDYQDEGYSRTGRVIDQSVQNPWQLSNYKPSLTENLQTRLGDYWGGTRDAHRRAKKAFRFVNDVTPVGNATGMDEGGAMFRSGLQRGHLGQMGLGAGIFALSASPLPGAVRRPVKGMFGNKVRNLIANEDGAIRAWHGSPHDFDRFDMSKIGTGEGAQAYGHGLYFAENPETARSYRDALITRDIEANGWNMMVGGRSVEQIYQDIERRAARMPMPAAQVEYDKLSAIESLMQHGDPMGVVESGQIDGQALDWFKRDIAPAFKRDGRLYEVNINAEPEDFLDWDAPLSGQPTRLQDFARNIDLSGLNPGNRTRVMMERFRDGSEQAHYPATGTTLLTALTHGQDNYAAAEASRLLRESGFAGSRYLDQGSRGSAGGTRNYVVFDDGLIDIIGKQ